MLSLLAVFILAVFITDYPHLHVAEKYDTGSVFGSDTYMHFGNGRYEVARVGLKSRMSLWDNDKTSNPRIEVVRYAQKGDKIYFTVRKDPDDPNKGFSYIILNYVSNDLQNFESFDGLPKEDQSMFNGWLNPWCRYITRTCY